MLSGGEEGGGAGAIDIKATPTKTSKDQITKNKFKSSQG